MSLTPSLYSIHIYGSTVCIPDSRSSAVPVIKVHVTGFISLHRGSESRYVLHQSS